MMLLEREKVFGASGFAAADTRRKTSGKLNSPLALSR